MHFRTRALVCLFWLTSTAASAQTSVQFSATTVPAANDFATAAFQDPWDMSQRTDLGWFLHGIDQPQSGFTSFSFSGGIFSGVIGNDPNLFLLETGFVGAAQVGKIGTNYPINTSVYQRFSMRMCSPAASALVFFWSENTIYDAPGLQAAGTVATSTGCRFYFANLATMPMLGGSTQTWTSTTFKRSLRLDPIVEGTAVGFSLQIDWARLTNFDASLNRNITWSGAGTYDIYLASANSPATSNPNAAHILGFLGNGSGGSFTFYAGGLEPGTYWVAMRQQGTSGNFVFSSNSLTVNAPPRITVTAPSVEGSSDDFATTMLSNPWDMNALSDVDLFFNVSGAAIQPVAVETPAGTSLGSPTMLTGTSTTGVVGPGQCDDVGDPIVSLLNETQRGFSIRINASKYRILTAELGYNNKARDICGGSVVRVVWHRDGDTLENESEDIILNTRAGANVLDTINVDMAALPIEPFSPAQTGWTGQIKSFRIDPHEFVNPTPFYIRRVKLAALEKSNTSYTIQWTSTEASGTVNVYRDDDKDPNVKTLIGSTSGTLSGSMVWNTSGLAEGAQYFIYVEQNDGQNTTGAYSKWPVRITHLPEPTAVLTPNRTELNFGVRTLNTITPAQTVRITASNAAAGQPCWTVSSSVSFVLVNPTSGCGSGSFTVSLLNQNYVTTGDGFATITISSAGAINSPQSVRAWFRIRNTSTPPSGVVDTPAQSAVLRGSVPFTGWAIDDIGVTRVTICRFAVTGESAPIDGRCGNGAEIYVGDAVLLDDARPDVAAAAPSSPFNYRAGWGFLALTNMLPNQGNGPFTFRIRAYDVEGMFTLLSTLSVTGDNANSVSPFGAIDTPGQGETISGTGFVNFGWALTPQPKMIPTNGSTINVFVDGVNIGNPSYNHPRSDIAALFPGLKNTNGPVGFRTINTTLYANGVHTIAWGVTDDGGAATGVGSRFFNIFNTGASPITSEGGGLVSALGPGREFGRTPADVEAIPARAAAVRVRRGFNPSAPQHTVSAGIRNAVGVWHVPMDRVEVQLADGARTSDDRFDGYMVVGNRLMALPAGSSLDRNAGVFSWQPVVGFVGRYEFVFIRTTAAGTSERIPMYVVLEPRESNVRLARLDVAPPFRRLFQ